MRIRGKRFELSEAETRVMLDLASKELMRQIKKHQISDLLTSIVTKLTRALKQNPDKAKGE